MKGKSGCYRFLLAGSLYPGADSARDDRAAPGAPKTTTAADARGVTPQKS